MRIIAGAWGGRRLKVPAGKRVRPTAGRVKESVFSILGEHVRGARVLDLYAGSGALGLEALSRGACAAVFVENDPVAARTLRENLERLAAAASVVRAPAERAVAELHDSFDLVFLDPPYGSSLAARTLEILGRAGVVAPGGLVVAEHSRRDELPDHAGALERVDRRRYGDTEVSFYARRE
jgi:16S rRNA (guanine966-N2)-methyltransferase